MSIHDETEADTRAERIDPVLAAAGWGQNGSKVRREVICPGRIQAGGHRVNPVSCDYVFEYQGQKLAVLEAKKASLSHREGQRQAIDYASRLKARFAYCSNGIKWREIDRETGRERDIDLPFPAPEELWARMFPEDNDWRNDFGEIPFATDGGKWQPRYYQHNAIAAVLEAIAGGENRILLTLATGTGKTGVAYQIAWKLFQTRWTVQGDKGRQPRILFLADRNILADQAYGSFSGFAEDARMRITPKEIRTRNGGMPKNANVFFSIFQTLMTSGADEPVEDEEGNIVCDGDPNYLDFPPDFFDLIIIDECHRAGARDASPWRGILEYFQPAVQLGLTATPRRDVNADTYDYFGRPVYEYSLKEGIEDGYLTPFKVRQMVSTIDEYVYRPGDKVLGGEIDPNRKYVERDFNSTIVMDEREQSRVREFMGQINPMQKTLVFCATQEHAAMVRDFINEIKPVDNLDYCVRVTANDGEGGEKDLRRFQDNEKTIPTILTTSRKLSTGVDARNVRNIVLMRPVTSMIEFKQIVGRGTRVFEGKDHFTIYDFVKAYEHFNDPEWDGEPLEPVARPDAPDDEQLPPDFSEPEADDFGKPEPKPEKVVVKLADGSQRKIQYMGVTTYWLEGRQVTGEEFLKRLFGDLQDLIAGEEALREQWSDPDLRKALLAQLRERGFDDERLDDMARLIDAGDSDIFDVLANVRFSLDPRTRYERAGDARTAGLGGYEREMREFLESVLRAYEQDGVVELGYDKLPDLLKIRYGTIAEARSSLGDIPAIKAAFAGLQRVMYMT